MLPWSKAKPAPAPSSDLEERMARLERAMKEVRADQDTWIEKISHLFSRISKRAALRSAPEQHTPEQIELTPEEEMNERIRRQRAGLRSN